MKKYRSALRFSLVAMLVVSTGGCLSGSGSGSPPVRVDADTPGNPDSGDGGQQSGPTVAITSPDAVQVDTVDETMDLGGTASGDVDSVSWESDKGASGTAEGTDSWSVQDIPLEAGSNTITVTATDAAGETSSDSIVIHRESADKGSVTLSWVAPTERTDGSPLDDLAGYRINYGRMSEIYDYSVEVKNPGLVSYVVEDLVPGDWYFTVVAFDSHGLESDFSNEAHRKVQ